MKKRENKIGYGDKIFARLTQGGKVLVEFVAERFDDIKEVMRELRRLSAQCRGISRLYIRNMTQGWSIEETLMLYPGTFQGL